MFDFFQDKAELISLGLTVPTVVLAVWVVFVFAPKAIQGIRTPQPDAIQWFAAGIAIGFFGSTLDNIYWAIPWTSSYLNLEETDFLVRLGVFFNIFSRQLCGIASAYCHIRCACEYIEYDSAEVGRLNAVLAVSVVVGSILAISLEAIR